ncbi:MAG: hypothetical protein ACLP01_26900 [Solirubrobacteraceae bacterium]
MALDNPNGITEKLLIQIPGKDWLMSLGRRLGVAIVAAMLMGMGACAVPAVAAADTMSISLSSSTSSTGIPITVQINVNAAAIEWEFAVVQPAAAGGCQPTYGTDESVVGSQATVLVNNQYALEGQSYSSNSFDGFTASSYTVCAWLESDEYDGAGSGDTSSVVLATAQSSFQLVDTDSLSTTLSTSTPRPNVPFTVTFKISATPIDSGGDGPWLYAVVQPAGAGGCQPTYGADLSVVGSQATVLVNNTYALTGQSFSSKSFTGSTGSYTVCAWLENDEWDDAGDGLTSSNVLATAAPLAFTIPAPPPACVVPRFAGASLVTVERRISAGHCTVGRVTWVRRRNVRRDIVISLSPAPGRRLASKAAVKITVSRG